MKKEVIKAAEEFATTAYSIGKPEKKKPKDSVLWNMLKSAFIAGYVAASKSEVDV